MIPLITFGVSWVLLLGLHLYCLQNGQDLVDQTLAWVLIFVLFFSILGTFLIVDARAGLAMFASLTVFTVKKNS